MCKLLPRFTAIVLCIFSFSLQAQIEWNGPCLTSGPVMLMEIGTENGRPLYSATDVTIDGITLDYFMSWDPGSPPGIPGAWILSDGDGAIVYFAEEDTPRPPGTDDFVWTDGGDYNFCSDASQLSIAGASAFLPVTWLGFTLEDRDKSGVSLHWQTASEEGNAGFTVQRSTDGQVWENLGFVPAASESGYAALTSDYQYTDVDAPSRGTLLYRLRQEDFDGTVDYSVVRQLSRSVSTGVSVWPNPVAEGELRFNGPTDLNGRVTILDNLGRRVLTTEATGNVLDVSQLPAGTYTLQFLKAERPTAIRFIRH